jgi:hypothetical protein
VTTKKKKPNENDNEINVCEVECQTHGDDTDSVATLIESCETEPLCSSSITDSTNNVKSLNLSTNVSRSLSDNLSFPSIDILIRASKFLWVNLDASKNPDIA